MDAMSGCSVKELDMVEKLFKIHPMVTLLGGDKVGISSDIKITKPSVIGLNSWLTDVHQFDNEKQTVQEK